MPGKHITDDQAMLFMTCLNSMPVESASAKACFSRSTGDRVRRDPQLPSQKTAPRSRCRPDPLANVFESEVVPMLEADLCLRPVAVFAELNPSIRRTLERRIRDWRARHGPEQEVIFRQTLRPGRLGLSDFTRMRGARRHLGRAETGSLQAALVRLQACQSGSRRREYHGASKGPAGGALDTGRRAAGAPDRKPVGRVPERLPTGYAGHD